MTFKQYCRIERSLGGVGCTDKQFIRACLDFILPQAKHHHLYRTARHLFIRDGLAYLNKARRLAFSELINRENNLPPYEGELDQAWYLNEASKYGYGE
jgi:hypothetical protein